MVLAETFQSLFTSAGFSVTRTKALIAVTVVALLPLCLLKDLSSLAPFSLLGIMGMIFTCATMAVRFFGGDYTAPDGKFLADLAEKFTPKFGDLGASAVFSPNAFILLCMLSTAYICHFNAPKFYIDLENNTIARFNKVVSTSFGISTLIFCVATAIGFLTFGSNSSGFVLRYVCYIYNHDGMPMFFFFFETNDQLDLTRSFFRYCNSNYSANDSLMKLSRLAVAFSLIFT